METDKRPSRVPFPVVGIGASAGAYTALMTLLQNMPPSPGMALVVILHLASDEPSGADRLLQSATDMPVVQVTHTMP
ncbi:MAG TPA: chemotaxis protein CheB, partial [Ramlibacter sp.]